MKLKNYLSIAAASAILFTTSCRNDDPVNPISQGLYENGVLITNEGNFGKPNAGISYIDSGLTGIVNDVYKTENNQQNLGDVLNSVAFSNNKIYLVVNNSNKVVVANRYTMKKEAEITNNIKQPRHATVAGKYLYVTNDMYQGPKSVSIYSTIDNSFVKSISFTTPAEEIHTVGSAVFVQNASFGLGNKVSIINTDTKEIAKEFSVPQGIISTSISYNNAFYVISNEANDSYIYKYSPEGNLIKSVKLEGIKNATKLDEDQNRLYFASGNRIYTLSVDLGTPQFLFEAKDEGQYFTLYGFNVINGRFYASEVNGFTANSTIKIYDIAGNVLKTFTAGMGTNGFYEN